MAWTAMGPRFASAQAARNASASAGLQFGGRHICGELAKIWTPSQPIEAALIGMPFRPPPETCAPRRTPGMEAAEVDAADGGVSEIVICALQGRERARRCRALRTDVRRGGPLYHANDGTNGRPAW